MVFLNHETPDGTEMYCRGFYYALIQDPKKVMLRDKMIIIYEPGGFERPFTKQRHESSKYIAD